MISVLHCKLPGRSTANQEAMLFRKKLNFGGTYYIAEVLCLTSRQQLPFSWLGSDMSAQISVVVARQVLLCLHMPPLLFVHRSWEITEEQVVLFWPSPSIGSTSRGLVHESGSL